MSKRLLAGLSLTTLALFAIHGLGCAAKSSVRTGSSDAIAQAAASEGARTAEVYRAAGPYAEAKCQGLLTKDVGLEEERAIGGVVWASLIRPPADKSPAALPEPPPDGLSARVSMVGNKLARLSSRPDLPWTFAVIQSEAVDAFSAPGGYVGVTTALLEKVSKEAQLAGVLAHEIGHVERNHVLFKYREGKNRQCVAANTAAYLIEHGGFSNPAMAQMATYARQLDGTTQVDASQQKFLTFVMNAFLLQLLRMGNAPEVEFETDQTAFELLTLAGYDSTEYEKLLGSKGSEGSGLVSKHPPTEDRVAKLKALREAKRKDVRKKR